MKTFTTQKQLQTYIQGAFPLIQNLSLEGIDTSNYYLKVDKGIKYDWKYVIKLVRNHNNIESVVCVLGGGATIDKCYLGFLHEIARNSYIVDGIKDFTAWTALLNDKVAYQQKIQDIDNDIQDNQ